MFTDRTSGLWPNNSRLVQEMGGVIPLWYKWVPPCSLLSAGEAQKMGTKGVSAEIQKLSLQKELTWPPWIYKKKSVPLFGEKKIITIVNWTTTSDDPSLLKINIWTMNHAGPVVVTSFLQGVLAFIFYLFYHLSSLSHLPKWLQFVINWLG